MTPKDRSVMREIIAAFVVVARHARNFPHPEIPVERLRREGVEAEMTAQNLLGEKEYETICKIAFKSKSYDTNTGRNKAD